MDTVGPAPFPLSGRPLPQPLPRAVEAALWRADRLGRVTERTCATGFEALDRELPGGGWPTHALTEVLQQPPRPTQPLAEWRLLLPCLSQLDSRLPVVLIGPPHPPHAPGLQQAGVAASRLVWVQARSTPERLWATEQLIKGPGSARELGAIVAWLPQAQAAHIRRLQTWALHCDAPVFLLRPAQARGESSAAPLRVLLSLSAQAGDLSVHLLKRRGPVRDEAITLRAWPLGLDTLDRPNLTRPTHPLRAQPPAPKETHALAIADPLHH
ncbi:MAG: translesion DNA synthesis-associated protein ImuA [Burkholderiales bacterium]|nr:translesion DNA synthesis-associated protein ImuA [Burkholderiales bacterium]